MTIAAAFFWMFAFIMVAAAVMVIWAKNPVHAVLYLILAFFNAAGLFVLLGAEFLAMILVVVYVGAVAVLFLFVVMMLDVDFAALRAGFIRYAPLGALIGFIVGLELVMVVLTTVISPGGLTAANYLGYLDAGAEIVGFAKAVFDAQVAAEGNFEEFERRSIEVCRRLDTYLTERE